MNKTIINGVSTIIKNTQTAQECLSSITVSSLNDYRRKIAVCEVLDFIEKFFIDYRTAKEGDKQCH